MAVKPFSNAACYITRDYSRNSMFLKRQIRAVIQKGVCKLSEKTGRYFWKDKLHFNDTTKKGTDITYSLQNR